LAVAASCLRTRRTTALFPIPSNRDSRCIHAYCT
jgi:hypothetical protein